MLLVCMLVLACTALAAVEQVDWVKVKNLEQNGLWHQADEETQTLLLQARREGDTLNWLLAVTKRLELLPHYREDAIVPADSLVQAELGRSQGVATSLLHLIRAKMLSVYYPAGGTPVLGDAGQGDIRTWDTATKQAAIQQEFQQALQNREALYKEPAEFWQPLVWQRERMAPQAKFPGIKLFDMVLLEYLNWLQTLQVDVGEMVVDHSWLCGQDEFIAREIAGEGAHAQLMRLYQQAEIMYNSHTAALAYETERLAWVGGLVPSATALADSLLGNILMACGDDEYGAVVCYRRAQLWYAQRDYNKMALSYASERCYRAANKWDGSAGATWCKDMLKQIEKPEASVFSRSQQIPNAPILLRLDYRNTEKVYLRVYRQPEKYRYADHGRIEYAEETPVRTVMFEVEDEYLHNYTSTEVVLQGLEPGVYFLAVSPDDEWPEHRLNDYEMHRVEVTQWYERHVSEPDGSVLVSVFNRATGEEVSHIDVVLLRLDGSSRPAIYVPYKTLRTDYDGLLRLGPELLTEQLSYLMVTRGDDTLGPVQMHAREQKPKDHTRADIFTDRAVYRPGQTVHYSGIARRNAEEPELREGTRHRRSEEDRQTNVLLARAVVTVNLRDRNWNLIESHTRTTDKYGGFGGTMVLPNELLTGPLSLQYRIEPEGETPSATGSVQIQVEEYKRPSFEVMLDSIAVAYSLGDTVQVTGHAQAYAGYQVGQASVRWSLERQTVYPWWASWWRWQPSMQGGVIAHGEAEAEETGAFQLAAPLLPEPYADPARKPEFHYVLKVDVTDSAGETRSAQMLLKAGYVQAIVELDVAAVQFAGQPMPLKVRVHNLQGQPLQRIVQLRLQRLKPPEVPLHPRSWAPVSHPVMSREQWHELFPYEPYGNEDDPKTWPVLRTHEFSQVAGTQLDLAKPAIRWLGPGYYMLEGVCAGVPGVRDTTRVFFTITNARNGQAPYSVMNDMWVNTGSLEVGETAQVVMLSTAPAQNVWFEKETGGVLQRHMLKKSISQRHIVHEADQNDAGGISFRQFFVFDNHPYYNDVNIPVAYTHKKLDVTLETSRSTLEPGAEENWTVHVRRSDGTPQPARVIAAMYDASLDAIVPHHWKFSVWRQRQPHRYWQDSADIGMSAEADPGAAIRTSSSWRRAGQEDWEYYLLWRLQLHMPSLGGGRPMPAMFRMVDTEATNDEVSYSQMESMPMDKGAGSDAPEAPRSNFAETAFFYPALQTDSRGTAGIRFTVPDALTRWACQIVAYTGDLDTGTLREEFTAQKELMAQPNLPRFLRMGDELVLPLRIQSMSDETVEGEASLELTDPLTGDSLNVAFGLTQPSQSFLVQPQQGTTALWRIRVPFSAHMVKLRFRAAGQAHTDVVELTLLVLPGRMLVQESLPLPVRGHQSKHFVFRRLQESDSATLRHRSLTLEMTSNPAWLAVLALPSLQSDDRDCAIGVFNWLYVNSVSRAVLTAHPEIEAVVQQWRQDDDALGSQLQRNANLKTTPLGSTPWERDARNEQQQRQSIAQLFDDNRMDYDAEVALNKLAGLRLQSGAWPWYGGMRASLWVTTHIVVGLGNMQRLHMLRPEQEQKARGLAHDALRWMDREAVSNYEFRLRNCEDPGTMPPTPADIHWMLAHTLWPEARMSKDASDVHAYWLRRAADTWLQYPLRMQAMLALVLQRNDRHSEAGAIVASLRDIAVRNEETGWHWTEPGGWWWYQQPIGTQVLMVQAFQEVSDDTAAIDEMRLWLLKQKQTQAWETSVATAEACQALLLYGTDWLAGTGEVEVSLGGAPIGIEQDDGAQPQAGTGWFRRDIPGAQITPAMAEVTVNNPNPGPAWGALYWQYYEDLDRIESSEQNPLRLQREMFRERETADGPVLVPLKEGDALRVGEKLVVRLTVETDRDMEFVHLQDMHVAGTEPVEVLSGTEWRGSLLAYRATKDTATHYYIDWLPRGVHTIENSFWAAQAGTFKAGISTVECLYAPEFCAHSQGAGITIGN